MHGGSPLSHHPPGVRVDVAGGLRRPCHHAPQPALVPVGGAAYATWPSLVQLLRVFGVGLVDVWGKES